MSKKKVQLLITATELFNAHGFRRITIDEISKTSNISKMTFYKYFKNKIDIAEAVLDTIYTEGKLRYYEMLEQDSPFSEKIENLLLISRTQTHAIGQSFFQDITDENSPLLDFFLDKQKEIKKMTIDFCKKAQKAGLIRKDISIDVMMFMLNSQHATVNQPDFVKLVPDVEVRCSMLASLFFYGFTGNRSK